MLLWGEKQDAEKFVLTFRPACFLLPRTLGCSLHFYCANPFSYTIYVARLSKQGPVESAGYHPARPEKGRTYDRLCSLCLPVASTIACDAFLNKPKSASSHSSLRI